MKDELILVLWFGLLLSAGFVAGVIGYVLNLAAIAHWNDGAGMLALRFIGIFMPIIGAVVGWV